MDLLVAIGAFESSHQQNNFYSEFSQLDFIRHLTLRAVFIEQKPDYIIEKSMDVGNEEEMEALFALQDGSDGEDASSFLQQKRKQSNVGGKKYMSSLTHFSITTRGPSPMPIKISHKGETSSACSYGTSSAASGSRPQTAVPPTDVARPSRLRMLMMGRRRPSPERQRDEMELIMGILPMHRHAMRKSFYLIK